MKKRIVILGTGSNSLELAEIVQHPEFSSLEIVGFLDDGHKAGTTIHGLPILGGLDEASRLDGVFFVNGIGSPGNHARRDTFIAATGIRDERFLTIIHPTASISPRATIGNGVILFQNVVIGTGAVLGNHVLALPQTTVSHDTRVGDHTCLATGVILSGNTRIGDRCYMGAGSIVRENTAVGDESLIGAGAVVIHDIAPQTVAAGNPARSIRQTNNA